ncbi:MAG: hypothetical protein BWY75_02465 [bacterium ADurb.Bin425]|nr:MAG: hypothetical protein BWY75_02465 [bacterium ADurb.Bin425]
MSSTARQTGHISAPIPSPSMKGIIGWSGVCGLPSLKVITCPFGLAMPLKVRGAGSALTAETGTAGVSGAAGAAPSMRTVSVALVIVSSHVFYRSEASVGSMSDKFKNRTVLKL